VKMTTPTLEALHLACRDPESRTRLSHEVNTTYYSRLERIVVRRGIWKTSSSIFLQI
jgi:hypothetical protein